ncbi:ankyrin repeat-containing protein At5g02620-like [Rosa rugosa]|uniref:ankyrin repeat-containing protein At5g02620-like n=1 Tax=Rosa rugosa TaxID=74645 RepID=UPI002B414553|nr:ankyrin repeat-containing protein At5g02620-like [Rosa rugosa]
MDPGLYEAVTSGDVDFLKRNIGDGDLLSQRTPKYNNILHLAAEFKHINVFTEVPQGDLYSPLFWAANKYGDTPLHDAARVGCNEVITFLIEHSKKTLPGGAADVESGPADAEAYKELLRVTNLRKDTAFHVAVQYGHNEVVNLLMAADPELCCFTNSANESPLFIAVRKGFHLVARSILVECPVSPSFAGTDGVTALHAAVTHININMTRLVKIMVLKVPDTVEKTDAIGWTPLHYAALRGYLKVTRILLRHDSSTAYVLDKTGMSALHVAACAGRTKVLKELIRYRPDACDLLNDKGQNILHSAVLGEQRFVINYIMKTPKLARLINEGDRDGNTPLHLAAIYKKESALTRKLATDPRVDKTAINSDFLHALDIYSAHEFKQNVRYVSPLFRLGRSVGVPFFHEQILHKIMALESTVKITSSSPTNNTAYKRTENFQTDGDSKIYNTNLLVAVPIATVTFAAAFTMPGGLKSDGTPVLQGKPFLIVFLLSDACSFFASIFVVFL